MIDIENKVRKLFSVSPSYSEFKNLNSNSIEFMFFKHQELNKCTAYIQIGYRR